MKKNSWILVAGLLLVLSAPALAGDGEKCSHDTQSCLDHMASYFQNRGWVGVEMDHDEMAGTLTIKMVEPDSPAKAAGLRKGDVLLAMNGIKFSQENKEAMKAAQQKMSVGSTVTYTVQRDGYKKDIEITLGQIPEAVVAKWIGRHMLDHATIELASAE